MEVFGSERSTYNCTLTTFFTAKINSPVGLLKTRAGKVAQSPLTPITNNESRDNHVVDENYLQEQCDADEKIKTLNTRVKYKKKFLLVALNIATMAASHAISQFTFYFEATRQIKKFVRDSCDFNISSSNYEKKEETRVVNEEPPEQPHTFNSNPSGNTEKFQYLYLRFRPKVQAQGRSKRPR